MAQRGGSVRPGAAIAAIAGLRPRQGRAIDFRNLTLRIGETWRAGIASEIANRRLFPWLAVFFGIGILLAFAADGSPSLWPPLVLGAGLASTAHAGRARLGRQAALLAGAALCFGFSAAALRTGSVHAPVLQRPLVAKVTGFVEVIEERNTGGGRVTLRVVSIEGIAEAERPFRVRVTLRSPAEIAPGDLVEGSARLMPPPEAARPGGYDFGRDAYFRGIGAVGSVSGRLVRSPNAAISAGPWLRASAAIDATRNALTQRIAQAIGGQAGAVSAALVTGKRGLIDEATNDILRAAGIYHVVSISGLHMVLAAGVFFALARGLLALSPALALGWPLKKIAAGIGMVGASAYCLFSGAEVATERSLIMILVMQGAILFDRPALSLRNLALSALIVLAREPEALLGPSFQMSYGAVAGLIALAEALRRWRPVSEPGDPVRRAAIWVGTVLLGTLATTLVATIATSPFGTYHFQTIQPYGLIGNAATLPLVSFAVMPAAVLGVLALPFGLDQPVWAVMGLAVQAVLKLSAWVAGFPSATVVTPAYGGSAILWLASALLVATLVGSRLRVLAVLPLAIGCALASAAPRPDIYVARDGTGAAIRGRDGRLVVIGPVSAFTIEQWLKADGDGRKPADPSLRAPARCDRIGCTSLLPDGRAVSHLGDRRGFGEDCTRAVVVVSRLSAPSGCAAAHVLDAKYLATHGATTLRIDGVRLLADTTRGPGFTKPWHPRPPPVAAQASVRPPAGARSALVQPPPAVADGDIPPEDLAPWAPQ